MPTAVDPRAKLIDALATKGLSLVALHRVSGVDCSRGSLHRKLFGYRKPGTKRARIYQPISLDEYRKLATALGVLAAEDAKLFERLGLDHLGNGGAAR